MFSGTARYRSTKRVELLKPAATDANPVLMSALVWGYARSGQREKAEEVFDILCRRREQHALPAIALAWCCANLGRVDEAFEWLDHAVRERCLELVCLNAEPMFEAIRSDPRFESLVASMGLSVTVPTSLGRGVGRAADIVET